MQTDLGYFRTVPKPLHHIDPILIHSLKLKLQSDIGVVVQNFSDCKRLSAQIFELKKERISASTLYRLYFSDETNNHFYLSTLDILVSIAYDKKSWNQYSEEYLESQAKLSFMGIQTLNSQNPSLLERCIEFNSWKPLCQWLEDLSADEKSMNSSLLLDNIGYHLRNILEKNPQWEKKFYEKTAHLPFIKTSFFELGTDPDFALTHSELSFEYYRKALNPKSPLFENDSLYIDTLECLYLFKKKQVNANKLYDKIKIKYSHIKSLKNRIHIFNLSRLWILDLHDYQQKNLNWAQYNWDFLFARIKKIFPKLESFEKRVLRFMVLDACLDNKVTKNIIETLLQLLDVKELPKYNETKLRYYLEQINPNGIRWRKQFSHF